MVEAEPGGEAEPEGVGMMALGSEDVFLSSCDLAWDFFSSDLSTLDLPEEDPEVDFGFAFDFSLGCTEGFEWLSEKNGLNEG